MKPSILLAIIGLYFLVLLAVAYFTSRKADSQSFYIGNKQSPWYLVAFGMIGASLSGVTFVSVPGWVNATQFSYFPMVLGYLLGYLVIGAVLMPLYYRLNLVSIYTYLKDRFGIASYKTGASFFLLSRTIGAAFRLFLVAGVMQYIIFDSWNVPFWVTVAITILLIWIYTFRGGIKTIVWTDSLQTFFMLLAVIMSIYVIAKNLNFGFGELISEVRNSEYAKMWFFEGLFQDNRHFVNRFFGGAFIALTMTGLDQDMMQKNLSCKNIGDAQKNMFWFSIVLVVVNIFFLALGALLYIYAAQKGISVPERPDYLFPEIAVNNLNSVAAIVFFLGLIAAAYSSADSALTSLTTSFCIDILGFDPKDASATSKRKRITVHIGFSILLLLLIIVFDQLGNDSVISQIFSFAQLTYGPILGLFAFGLLTKWKSIDALTPIICILAPVLAYAINQYGLKPSEYDLGYLLLPVNGGLTFLGLLFASLVNRNQVEN
ncbi:MAG: sodium:solute symporter [Saprospiraceae bacterium]|nr:sodium:solute symporter [Saprospiraceae bacterium]